jgi:large subunit ribosomal protein L20
MHGIKLAGLGLDRKVLSDLAVRQPGAFAAIVATAREALPAKPAAAAWGASAPPACPARPGGRGAAADQ